MGDLLIMDDAKTTVPEELSPPADVSPVVAAPGVGVVLARSFAGFTPLSPQPASSAAVSRAAVPYFLKVVVFILKLLSDMKTAVCRAAAH